MLNEILLCMHETGKVRIIPSAGGDRRPWEPSCTTAEDVNWCRNLAEDSGGNSKLGLCIHFLTQQVRSWIHIQKDLSQSLQGSYMSKVIRHFSFPSTIEGTSAVLAQFLIAPFSFSKVFTQL